MPGKIYQYLADDHARLDALLQRSAARAGGIETSAYTEFRAGLLKHIAMEEKILLPAAQRARAASRSRSPLSCGLITARLLRCSCRRRLLR